MSWTAASCQMPCGVWTRADGIKPEMENQRDRQTERQWGTGSCPRRHGGDKRLSQEVLGHQGLLGPAVVPVVVRQTKISPGLPLSSAAAVPPAATPQPGSWLLGTPQAVRRAGHGEDQGSRGPVISVDTTSGGRLTPHSQRR